MSLPPEHLSKSALRKIAREARHVRVALEDGAAEKLADFADDLSLGPDHIIAGYVALGTEINVRPLLDALAEKGHEICLPVVLKKDASLIFRRWAAKGLEPGLYGTSHPAAEHPEMTPDIVLVPLLAFDARGHRLGYGGGYYDRTLSLLRRKGPVFACGVAFRSQEVDALPFDPYDEQLDAVLTEDGLRQFERDA